jgi:hypothetical protein
MGIYREREGPKDNPKTLVYIYKQQLILCGGILYGSGAATHIQLAVHEIDTSPDLETWVKEVSGGIRRKD